jgi:hypothetical protein
MATWAIVKDNKVVNRIVADTKEIAEEVSTGFEVIDDEGWIGISYERVNNEWRAPYPTDGEFFTGGEYTWDSIERYWKPVNTIIIEE